MIYLNKGEGVDTMTDSEKLDLMLEKISSIESDVKSLKRQQMKFVAELKAMDSLILDEVERVHEILDKHKEDKAAHVV